MRRFIFFKLNIKLTMAVIGHVKIYIFEIKYQVDIGSYAPCVDLYF